MAFKMKGFSPFTNHEEGHEKPTANYASFEDLENDPLYKRAKNSKEFKRWTYLDKSSDYEGGPTHTVTQTATTGDPATERTK